MDSKIIDENILKTPFKGKDILYHSTTQYALEDILKSNTLLDRTIQGFKTSNGVVEKKGVSLTRNYDFKYEIFTLILDGAKIRQNYKLIPFDYFASPPAGDTIQYTPKNSPKREKDTIEYEEFVIGSVKNLNKYLLAIRCNFESSQKELSALNDLIKVPIYDENGNDITSKIKEMSQETVGLEEVINPQSINLNSFEEKKELNPYFFDNSNKKIRKKVKQRLLKIADDFKDSLDVNWVDTEDIVLTGSISNYNWSKYSDVDLHLIIDFKKVDDNIELVKNYFDSKKKEWSNNHDNLTIYGFPVELYCQDVNEKHASSGIYSLEKNNWIIEPEIINPKLDKNIIKEKSAKIMDMIDKLYSDYALAKDDIDKTIVVSNKVKKIWDKIKAFRKKGLEKDGEFSYENIIFKVLRRTEYIQKLADLKSFTYDRLNSLK